MARPGGYGRVGGKRAGGAIWQWILLGLMFGVGCSAVLVLTLLTFNVLSIGEDEPEQVTVQITAPPDPLAVQNAVNANIGGTLQALQAQQQPTIDAIVNATLEAQQAAQEAVVMVPTNTPETQAATSAETSSETSSETSPEGSGGAGTSTDAGTTPTDSTTDAGAGTSVDAQAAATEEPIDPNLALVISPMVIIPGGTFQMGTTLNEIAVAVRECTQRDGANCVPEWGEDSVPPHEVTLDTFQMEVTEVTNEQYVAFLNSLGPGQHTTGCSGRLCVATATENENSVILFDGLNYAVTDPILNNLPAVTVTWFGAQAYCEAIGRRLPTEAEWEYAARNTQGDLYPWGMQWNDGVVEGINRARTSRPDPDNIGVVEVRSYSPLGDTAAGLSDMAGNAAEWVADWYDPDWYNRAEAGGLNPTGPTVGRERVLRGGSWASVPFFARSVHRQSALPDATEFWVSFRCVDAMEEVAPAAGAGNVEGLGDLPETGTGADSEAIEQPDVNAAPTLAPDLSLPATEAPAVPPVGDNG